MIRLLHAVINRSIVADTAPELPKQFSQQAFLSKKLSLGRN